MPPRPSQPFQIREMFATDKSAIVELAQSLDEFFPKDYIKQLDEALDDHPAIVGELGKKIVGFLVYRIRDTQTAEITWIGILQEYHGLGLGSHLLDSLEQQLEKDGVRKLIASTLSYTVPYQPFEKVRTFYYHRGFTSLGIQQNYYDEGLDRLILVKNL